jgi:WD40 repeat protein
MASCGEDKQVFLWDTAEGRVIRRFRGHTSVSHMQCVCVCVCRGPCLTCAQRVNCCKFNLEYSAIVTGSYDKSVKVFLSLSLSRSCHFHSADYYKLFWVCTQIPSGLGHAQQLYRCYSDHGGRKGQRPVHCCLLIRDHLRVTLSSSHFLSSVLPFQSIFLVKRGTTLWYRSVDGCVRTYDLRAGRLIVDHTARTPP